MKRSTNAFLLRVFAQSGLNWIRVFAKEHEKKPEPTGRTIVLELDEMWHYLKEKRCKLWLWKALDQETGQLLDWECGRPDKVTLKKMVNRLAQWDVKLYCTDKWATYFFSPQPLRPSASSVSALNSPARRHPACAGSGQDGRAPGYHPSISD